MIYEILQKIKVPVAKHFFVYRDDLHLSRIESKSFGKNIEQKESSPEAKGPTLLRSYYEKQAPRREYYSVDEHEEDDFIFLRRGGQV